MTAGFVCPPKGDDVKKGFRAPADEESSETGIVTLRCCGVVKLKEDCVWGVEPIEFVSREGAGLRPGVD